MTGYNIECDPGDLYSRKCYVINPTTGKREEIIGYDSAGNPLSKGETTAAGTAWQINYTTLNQDGTAYQPYGTAGVPWTLAGGIAGLFGITPSSGADLQDWKYITESAPGSQARKTYQQRVCNPLWPTFGCRQAPLDSDLLSAGPTAAASQPSTAYEDRTIGEKIVGWWRNLLGN